jgi:hypothetical protein
MMKIVRWAASALLATAALPGIAASPMSNHAGDGEANVPFATLEAAEEPGAIGGGSGEPGRVEAWAAPAKAAEASPVSNHTGDGEANVPFATSRPSMGAAELGGGSGEPGRIEAKDAEALAREAAHRAEADREFERHVWTDP